MLPATGNKKKRDAAKGDEAAALIGGHSRKTMTDHYTVEAMRDLALDVAAEVG